MKTYVYSGLGGEAPHILGLHTDWWCCIGGARTFPKGVGAAGKCSYKLKFKPLKGIYTEQCSILGGNAVFTDRPRILRIEEHKKIDLVMKFDIFPPFLNLDFFQNESEGRENFWFLLSPKSTHGLLIL
jgi:hypothetical protein